jgi:hypothetical protein
MMQNPSDKVPYLLLFDQRIMWEEEHFFGNVLNLVPYGYAGVNVLHSR